MLTRWQPATVRIERRKHTTTVSLWSDVGCHGREPALQTACCSASARHQPRRGRSAIQLRESGYTTSEAVAAYACIGPAQLAGRIAILTLERLISLTAAGLIGTLFPVVAVIILITLRVHSPLLAAQIWQLHGSYHLLEIALLVTAGVPAAAFVLAARLRPNPVMPSLVSA